MAAIRKLLYELKYLDGSHALLRSAWEPKNKHLH